MILLDQYPCYYQLYLIKYLYISTTKNSIFRYSINMYIYIYIIYLHIVTVYLINLKPHQFFAADTLLRLQRPHGGQVEAQRESMALDRHPKITGFFTGFMR